MGLKSRIKLKKIKKNTVNIHGAIKGPDFGRSGDTVTGSSKALLSPEPRSVNKGLRQSRAEAPTHAQGPRTHADRQSESAQTRAHLQARTLTQAHHITV